MAKKTTRKAKAEPKVVEPKVEAAPIPEIWKCKVDWCYYGKEGMSKKKRYIKDEQIMLPAYVDSANDAALNRYFEKVAVKVDTIISEPVELAEGD